MALVKKKSSFDAYNVVLSVPVTPQFYKDFFLTLKVWTNSILEVPTLRVPRSSARRNASLIYPLELTIRPTTLIPSTSLALVSLREPQGLMFHLYLLSSRSPLRLCSRTPHLLPLVWIFAMSLLSKNLKWMKSSSILLVFLIIPQRHIGPCMLSPRRNALPQQSPTSRAPLHRYTLEFGVITTPKVEKFFFCPDVIELCGKGSRRKWIDKFSVDQERPPIPPLWPVKIGTNLIRLKILKLENTGFQLPLKEHIMSTRLFNTSTPPLDLSGVDVIANPVSYPSSRQSKSTRRSATALSNNTNADGRICMSYGRDHFEGRYDSTPWVWLRAHAAIQTCTYTIYLWTESYFPVRV